MSTTDLAVLYLNAAGTILAIGANVVAAHVGFLLPRWFTTIVACIAGMYLIGYGLLLTGTIEVLNWSSFYRGVSVFVWPIVWAGPALLSLAMWRHSKAEIERALAERVERERSDRGA